MNLIALTIHLASVVLWIGGISFATLVLLPTLSSLPESIDRLAILKGVLNRFRPIALASSLILLGSGLFRLFTGYGGIGFIASGPRGIAVLFMILGWLVLTAVILLLPLREHTVLNKIATSLNNSKTSTKALQDFNSKLRSLQRVHYLVLSFGLLLVADEAFVLFGWQ